MQMKVFFHISYDNFNLLWPSLMKFLCKLKIDQSKLSWFWWFSGLPFHICKPLLVKMGNFQNFKLLRKCNKIFVRVWNLFRRNLFHRKFVLSELFKWTISSWNIFHRKIYSAYVKFVLVSISRPTVKFVSEWTLQKQWLFFLLDKV